MNSKRLGFVGIIIEDREQANEAVHHVLSQHGDMILARVGLPYRERDCAVITLVVDTTTDALGKLAGRLGSLPGVSVKSMLSKETGE